MTFAAALAPLSWLGRQGPRAVVGVMVAALLLPGVGQWLKPFAAEAVFALLTVAFLRLDTARARAALRRPGRMLAALAWTSLAIPALIAAAGIALGLRESDPALFLALLLQGLASPMMVAPALVALVGLDATLVLIVMVVSSLLVPLTAPVIAHAVLGESLSLDAWGLGVRLCLLVAGSAALGMLIRRLLGLARLRRHDASIGGLNIVCMFVFAAAVMQAIPGAVAAAPLAALGVAALAMGVALALLAVTVLVFLPFGRECAQSLGLMCCLRNMGLMIAATGGALPEGTWVYFGMSQIPIHLAPWCLHAWMTRARCRSRGIL